MPQAVPASRRIRNLKVLWTRKYVLGRRSRWVSVQTAGELPSPRQQLCYIAEHQPHLIKFAGTTLRVGVGSTGGPEGTSELLKLFI